MEHPAAGAAPEVDWASVRHAVVARLDNLGDVVLTGPLLRAVRAGLPPGSRLTLLASPAGAAAATLLPEVDDVLVARAVWQDAGAALPLDPRRELGLVEQLRGADLLVASTSFSQSPWPVAYAAYLAGVSVRAGQSAEFGGSLLTHWLLPGDDDRGAHQVDRSLRLAAALGLQSQGADLRLTVPAGTQPLLEDGFVLVAPGASAPARRYPHLGAVVGALRAVGLRVVVVGSEREADLVAAVSHGIDGATGLSVPELTATLQRASVVVTNNSACMHLADALGTAQVALFAGTEELTQYAPRGGRATVLRRPTWCTPCRAFTCPYAQECLDVAPAEVAAAVLARLVAPAAADAPSAGSVA